MKIAIDSRSATWYHGTGIGTYTENILRELLSLDSDNEYMLYWSGKSKDYILNNPCKKILTSKNIRDSFSNTFSHTTYKKIILNFIMFPRME